MVIMQHASYVYFRNTTSCLTVLSNFTFDPGIPILVVERKTGLKKYFWLKMFWQNKKEYFYYKVHKTCFGFFSFLQEDLNYVP